MGRKWVSEKVKRDYKKAMGKLVDGLGRVITVYVLSYTRECPNCFFDSVNKRSLGKCKWSPQEAAQKQSQWESEGNTNLMYRYFINNRCPVCDGVGFLKVVRRKKVRGIVNWGGARPTVNTIIQTPAGREGSTEVLIKTDVKYYELFKNCKKIVVDGIDCVLSDPPYKKGLGNESTLLITAYTSEKLTTGKSEVGKGYYG